MDYYFRWIFALFSQVSGSGADPKGVADQRVCVDWSVPRRGGRPCTTDSEGQCEPSIADIASLVESFRTMFSDVQFTVCNDCADVDSGVQLACYRIVQESLSNASRYAPRSRALVHVEEVDEAIVVTVLNGAGSTRTTDAAVDAGGQGFGIVGMRERVTLLGGSLVAQAVDDGWSVRAELPVHGRIAA